MCKAKVKTVAIGIAVLFILSMAVGAFATDWKPDVTSSVSSFQGGGFTGAGSYSIPINAPRAIGGMVPNIAITYSTQQIDDGGSDVTDNAGFRLSKGWRISGIPSIQRESLDTSVFYLVFGSDRSKLILGSDGYYHTENENFARIKFESASDYWWMKTKDGTYYKFGSRTDAKQFTKKNNTSGCGGNYNMTYEWDVEEVTNIAGDKISFFYSQIWPKHEANNIGGCTCDTDQVVIHGIDRIHYNYHNTGYAENRAFVIYFNLEPDPYDGQNHVFGDYVMNTSDYICVYWVSSHRNYTRYKDIFVGIVDATTGIPIERLAKYKFSYDMASPLPTGTASENMQLTSIKTVIGTDESIPATTFTYDSGGKLTSVYNPATGATKQMVYESYTLNSKTRYRVTSATNLDGIGNSYTTTYEYGTPVWDTTSKEFWGHSWSKTINAAGHYNQTWYYQDAVKKGIAYETQTKDASGNLYSKSTNVYSTSNPYPGVNLVLLTKTDNYLCDGDTTCEQTEVTYDYDTYGNATKVSNMGDVGENGDELYSYTEYINDTTNWRLGVPKHMYTKKSDDSTIVAEAWNYYSNTYNGAIDYATSNKYLRKVEKAAVFGSRQNAANPTATTTYDQYGNVTSVTDALGHSTTTAYDSTYHTFPISVTNALNQTAYTYYYGVNASGDSGFTGQGLFGQVKSAKDINGHFQRMKYDLLGRSIAMWNENFSEALPAVNIEYAFYSSATSPSQVVTKKRKAAGSSETFNTYTYTDGLGRTIQTQSLSEQAGKLMISGPVDYNSLGQVWKKYIGYKAASTGTYISSPAKSYPVTYTYDPVGRVIRTDNPDGTNTRTFYNKYVTTAVDTENKQLRSTIDAYGRTVKKESFSGSYPNATLYTTTIHEYDPLGRLVKTTDNVGNINTFTYDTLGQKTAMTDMDMGTWTYDYDILGRLIGQTDNKGQIITVEYDALSRMTKKNYPDGSWMKNYYDTYSGYTGTNSLGKLVKTEKGRN